MEQLYYPQVFYLTHWSIFILFIVEPSSSFNYGSTFWGFSCVRQSINNTINQSINQSIIQLYFNDRSKRIEYSFILQGKLSSCKLSKRLIFIHIVGYVKNNKFLKYYASCKFSSNLQYLWLRMMFQWNAKNRALPTETSR